MKASANVDVYATYPLDKDPDVSPKEHVKMVAREIWQLTGYRFT
jgi:hypothetical protein